MKKIAVFTGNRAEFGLLLPVIQEIKNNDQLELQLFVAGAHLEESFGKTIEVITASNIPIAEKIKISLQDDDLYSTSIAIGEGIIAVSHALKKHRPDMLIVYADRFEGLAAVIAASQMGIAVAHIEGGDITEGGALDDSVRHAMTKFSHLHFTTNQDAYDNVLALGEEKWRIENAGLPSLDHILAGKLATRSEIIDRLNLDLSKPLVLFTQHSVTTQSDQAAGQIDVSLSVIKKFLKEGVQFVITYPNNDAGGEQIIKRIENFSDKSHPNLRIVPSLGGYMYHGILSLALEKENRIVCMGNSSSGIKETPVFQCPTVNIGSRQNGRLQAKNVLNVEYNENNISRALTKCLYDDNFRSGLDAVKNLYGDGTASKKIVKKILEVEINSKLIQKKHIFNGK